MAGITGFATCEYDGKWLITSALQHYASEVKETFLHPSDLTNILHILHHTLCVLIPLGC